MAERGFTLDISTHTFPSWNALWAGMLTFVAIWSVFGILGAAIFASIAVAGASFPGLGVGMGFWAVILMVVAMYFAGRTTGRLSGKMPARLIGTMLFALSVFAALVVDFFARLGMGTLAFAGFRLGLWPGLGWVGFAALILGWVAAVYGVSTGMTPTAAQSGAEARRAA